MFIIYDLGKMDNVIIVHYFQIPWLYTYWLWLIDQIMCNKNVRREQ